MAGESVCAEYGLSFLVSPLRVLLLNERFAVSNGREKSSQLPPSGLSGTYAVSGSAGADELEDAREDGTG
jgi:hypothetical protein